VTGHAVGPPAEWQAARLDLLAEEKDLNRRRDALAEARRRLPWVPVEEEYRFDDPDGSRTLADLFDGRSQLLVYHFMFGPDWEEGCPSCSFWADSFDGVVVHLNQRDVTLVCVSRAPCRKLAAYQARMGWHFPWFSSAPSDFNVDFGVSFTPEQQEHGGTYNFAHVEHPPEEAPGISAFALADGQVFHTYSTFSRGLDPVNSGYQLLDLAPRGRDEGGLEWPMAWLRRHDAYGERCPAG
jgi:predicted dithiol-disulfide oxidoreductase (DUF899 family)